MDYYIKPSGNDSNSGETESLAWATIGRLNTFMSTGVGLEANDNVFFERDGVWEETLDIPVENRGSSGNHITFGAFGTGALPIISGLKSLTGWTSLGANLYEKIDVALPPSINLLILEGNPRPKKLGPILRISSNGTSTTLVSDNIPAYDYSGGKGEVVIETRDWIHDKTIITNLSGNTLTHEVIVPDAFSSKEGYRYLIQNLPETLTEDGDWMYDPDTNKITMYSISNPDSRDIEVTVRDYGILGNGNWYNTFENLEVKGAALENIRLDSSTGSIVEDSTISLGAGNGIGLWTSANAIVKNCLVDKLEGNGIVIRNASGDVIVDDNTISNISQFFGSGPNGGSNADGIQSASDSTIIRWNKVINVGYLGIRFSGDDANVYENYIENYCQTRADGGAIYCYGGQFEVNTNTNRKVQKNIALNNNPSGGDGKYTIYIDDNSENIDIDNQVLIDNKRAAYFNHNSHEINFINNLVYGGSYASIYGHNSGRELIRNNIETGNTKVLRGSTEHPYLINTDANDINLFGTINDNTFIFLSKSEFVVPTIVEISGKKTFNNLSLAQWQALGYDTTSNFQYITNIPEIDIISESENLFLNPTFNSGTDGVGSYLLGGSSGVSRDSSSKITGQYSLKAYIPSGLQESTETTRVELSFSGVGSISSSKIYVVRFKALAPSGHQSLNCYMRRSSTPYTMLSPEVHSYVGNTVKEFEFFFTEVGDAPDFNFMIDFQSHQGDLYIDDMEIKEVVGTATDYTDHVEPFYNKTKSSENISLTGSYTDIDNNAVSSPITILPFEGVFLKKLSSVNYSVSVTSVNGTVSGAGDYDENDEVTLIAIPSPNYAFARWEEDGLSVSTSNPYVFTITEDRALTAIFTYTAPTSNTWRYKLLVPASR